MRFIRKLQAGIADQKVKIALGKTIFSQFIQKVLRLRGKYKIVNEVNRNSSSLGRETSGVLADVSVFGKSVKFILCVLRVAQLVFHPSVMVISSHHNLLLISMHFSRFHNRSQTSSVCFLSSLSNIVSYNIFLPVIHHIFFQAIFPACQDHFEFKPCFPLKFQ